MGDIFVSKGKLTCIWTVKLSKWINSLYKIHYKQYAHLCACTHSLLALILNISHCAIFRCPLGGAAAGGESGPWGGGLSEALPTQSEGSTPDEHKASAVDRQCR